MRSASLADTCRRLVRICPALQADVTTDANPSGGWTDDGWTDGQWADGRWTDGARLAADPETLDAFVGAEAARIASAHGHIARRDVAASRALHHYVWSVALLMSGSWYLERRVPHIGPRDVRIDLGTGDLAFAPGAFSCLPDDPATATPEARTVPDEEALRAELRTAVVEHVRPLLTALAPQLRRGSRVLWGMVGDDLVSAIWYLGRMLDQEDRSVRAATELLPGPIAPFPGGADFRRLRDSTGRTHPTRTRLGCCLYYTIRPEAPCLTCPRTCDAERLERLTAAC